MNKAERDRLLAEFLEGDLSDADCQPLLDALRGDDDFQDAAARELMVKRYLQQQQFPRKAFTNQVMETLRGDGSQGDLTDDVIADLQRYRRRQRNRAWIGAVLAAAATLMLGFFLAGSFDKTVRPIVRVVAAEGVGTLNSQALESGQMIRLERGLLELELNGGESRVVIEAPASFQVVSARHLKLESGRCFAEMEEGNSGLRIETPAGDALDLGTKFAIDVRSSNEMEVHVFDGEVEVSSGEVKKRLTEGEAAAFEDSGTIAPMDANAGMFVHRVPSGIAKESSFLHWSFDEGSGDVVEANGTDSKISLGKGQFFNRDDDSASAKWASGVVGSALEFDGNTWIQTSHAGISGGRDRTVACWVKLPVDEGDETDPLIAWGLDHASKSDRGKSWQMVVTRHRQRSSNSGKVRINVGKYNAFGTTDLRDGQWHHIAAVTMEGDLGTTILIYVDGELENVKRGSRFIETVTTDQKSKPIQFGRHLFAPKQLFRGSLDEVYLFDSALSGDEVRQVMKLIPVQQH